MKFKSYPTEFMKEIKDKKKEKNGYKNKIGKIFKKNDGKCNHIAHRYIEEPLDEYEHM